MSSRPFRTFLSGTLSFGVWYLSGGARVGAFAILPMLVTSALRDSKLKYFHRDRLQLNLSFKLELQGPGGNKVSANSTA